MYRDTKKKIIHIIVIIVIIFALLCTAGILILKYQVEGEANLPFHITKIAIAQSVVGTEKENHEEQWNFDVSENNDIYIYFEKNSGYGKTEIIDSILVDNIKINKNNDKGETKLYKPVEDEKAMFKNIADNEMTEITYKGELESNIKQQKISNQGGIVAFRYAINNISNYISNDTEEVDHSKLLKLTNIVEDDIKTKISLDITINLTTGRKYKTSLDIEIPTSEVIEKGTVGTEITDFSNLVFKRIEN